MVSSGSVNGNLGSFQSLLKSYQTELDNASSGWKGISHDNLITRAEAFLGEYQGIIESQISAFSTACGLYQEYLTAKKNLSYAKDNYNQAVANRLDASSFQADINHYTEQVSTLKAQINTNLEAASSKKLLASSSSFGSVGSTSLNSTNPIQSAIQWALEIADDDSFGYSMNVNKRWGNPSYDCSSLVIQAWEEAGIPVKSEYRASYTGNMKDAFLATGEFEWIPGDPDPDDLVAGDILLNEVHHTEMYLGDGKKVGAHWDWDDSNGDGGGDEINVSDYSSYPWDGVLRYTGKS